jgi:biopolymer transport protein ExbB/TolQ
LNIGALLKSFIYLISSSLLYPVLFLLVAMTLWLLVFAGSFAAEWLERRRLAPYLPDELPKRIKNGSHTNLLSHRSRQYIDRLRQLMASDVFISEMQIENMIQETSFKIWKSMDLLRVFVRVAPGLGLIGTLIPMGTGLAALGQGDMTRLSSDLVIAFTTTVVGLTVGTVAFFFYTIKRRWVEEDIKNIELATEVLMTESGGNDQ